MFCLPASPKKLFHSKKRGFLVPSLFPASLVEACLHSLALQLIRTSHHHNSFIFKHKLFKPEPPLGGAEIGFFPYLYANLAPGFRIQSDYVWTKNVRGRV